MLFKSASLSLCLPLLFAMSTIGQSFNYNAEAGLSIKLTKQSTSRVEITLKSTSGEVGWAGIGVGEGMMDADIVLCSAGNLGLKRYKGGMGQLSPADAAAIDLQLVPASSSKAATAKGPFQCTFSRKVDNSDSFLKGTAMIWAVGGDDGSKPGYHSARGVFTSDADLQESVPAPTNKPSPSSIPETPGTIDAPTTEMNGDQGN